MPEFLYRIRPTRPAMLTEGPTPEEAQATQAHFTYLKRGIEAGFVLMAGRTLTKDEGTFGIVIFRAASEEDARAIMGADPAIEADVMAAELFPFRLALLNEHWDQSSEAAPSYPKEVPKPPLQRG